MKTYSAPLLLILTTFIAMPSLAEETPERSLFKVLQEFQKLGFELHEKYDTSKIDQLKTCALESPPLSDPFRSKERAELKEKIMKLDFPIRMPLMQTFYLAFSCVSCFNKDAIIDCEKMTKYLDRAEKILQKNN